MSEDRRELERLLEKARNHALTEEEIRAQRASWVRGEMGLGTDRDEAEARAAVFKAALGNKHTLDMGQFVAKTRRSTKPRLCRRCGETKPSTAFAYYPGSSVIRSHCMACEDEKATLKAEGRKHLVKEAKTP